MCCGYSLEAPQRGASDEYDNICFRGEIRKILVFFSKRGYRVKIVSYFYKKTYVVGTH